MSTTYTQHRRPLAVETPLGEDALLLTAFAGHEELSRPFAFDLEMQSTRAAIAAADIVGKPLTFRVRNLDGTGRYFNGYVSRFAYAGRGDRLSAYRAEVVPWLWFLTQTSDCRIFQNKTVVEIVSEVFDDLGFAAYETAEVRGAHPRWEYCVQYRETDFEFVSRLLERTGIFYYFRHENGRHTLVLADHAGAYHDCPEAELSFAAPAGAPDRLDNLTAWEHSYAFGPGRFAHTDYRFQTPGLDLTARADTVVPLPGNRAFERFEYPGCYQSRADGEAAAAARMEAEETLYDVVNGSSRCRTFTPGGRFRVTEHHGRAERDRAYVLTSVWHESRLAGSYVAGGEGGNEVYANRFACIPDDATFRPARVTPKPTIAGAQTAVVTGPAGQELYVDEFGRVKVQFHWDRLGRRNENSSCWIRVGQLIAGKQWGASFWPRIGQEVIVSFLEGDPDQPIIVGTVYNGGQRTPYAGQGRDAKHRSDPRVSGIKTNSTPGGTGFHELRFDDAAGREELFIHAQRNMDVRVKHDAIQHVGADRHVNVAGEACEHVGKDVYLRVDGDVVESLGKNHVQLVTEQYWLQARRVFVQAADEIRLVVGGNYISISPAGIAIEGKMVDLNCGSAPGSCESPPAGPCKPPRPADDSATGDASAPR